MTTILVIEDTAALREEILQLLDLMNFRGIGAADGATGVQLALHYLPDVIICDVMMPEMDGYAVLKQLQENPETAQIPFIFLTAKADRSDIRRGMNLGADDYLTKPFTSDDLGEAIAARLHRQASITLPYMSEMKRAAEQLGQIAFQDGLTGLPTRILCQQALQNALRQAQPPQTLTLFCLKVEQLRAVNTRFGQSAGDTLLLAIAARLNRYVTPQDTVARLSEDEFCLILVDLDVPPSQIADSLLTALSAPHLIQDQSMRIQVSLGATIYPEDDSDSSSLLNHALIAMNWGRNQGICSFYSHEMAEMMAQRNLLEQGLREALNRAELQVYYQPQVNLVTGRIIGAEALLRWESPEFGTVMPSTFLPIAEETGLIVPIGEWLMRTACLQAKAWQKAHLLPIRMSVNLSAHQFEQPRLDQAIAQILKETQLEPELFALELSEATVMADVEASLITLQALKQIGIHIGIDNFGTAYSSLNYLSRLPIDLLKIDQIFVQTVTTDEHHAAIAAATTALARSLNLRVIAEGVETQEQLTFLRRQGCNAIQGFLFSPAISANQFKQLLTEGRRLPLPPQTG